MKIRKGFVSNSSSSSFIIAVKGELTSKKVLSIFDIKKNSFWKEFAELSSEYLVSRVGQVFNYGLGETYYLNEENFKICVGLKEKGYTVYSGNIEDYGEGGDAFSTALRKSFLEMPKKVIKKKNIFFKVSDH